jgi:pimeloyl-ACP methyl ester carboxylesterase
MKTPLVVLAALMSALAIYLPARTQAFTNVTVHGRSIRMLITGSGDATVVFESGGGASLEMWGKVQPAVSRFARTVSYDRAGAGLSDAGPAPRDGRRIAYELHLALREAQIAPPYVLVGASMGGPYARIYAGQYPEDVAGMVLVDPTTDNQVFDSSVRGPSIDAWPATVEQSRASRIPNGVPVLLIDAVSPLEVPFASAAIRTLRMNNRPEIEADSIEYQRWLSTFAGGQRVITNRSGHNVAIEQPQLVIDSIRQVVEQANARK